MGKANKIMIALADQQMVDLLTKNILGSGNYTIANSVKKARIVFYSFGPNILLLGDDLPDGSCLELAEELIQKNPVLQIIYLGSEKPSISIEQAMKLGFSSWMKAPYVRKTILDAVNRANERLDGYQRWLKEASKHVTGPLEQRLDDLEAIFNISRMMTSKLDLDQVLSEVVDAAIKITDAVQGSILLLDEESGELYMRAARNFQEEFVRTFRLPVDDTYAGQVLQSGEPFFLNETDPQKIKTAYLVHSLIYVPLISHGHPIGVLSVDNRETSRRFDHKNITALSTMADYAAIAIENAKLYSETELERSKLASILTQIEDGVIVIDEDENLQMVNHVVRKAFGLGDEPLLDKKYYQVFSNRDLLMTIRGESLDPERMEIKVDDNSFYRAKLVEIEGIGKVVGLHDITYLKELDSVKTEFVNMVSHDLRSPLTSILGYVELIRRVGEVNEKQDEYIRRVNNSVYHITNLITELLNLGKIESRVGEKFQRLNFSPIIKDVVKEQHSKLELQEQSLHLKLPESLPEILGDSIQLRQMTENLVGNAIKFTPKGGMITVEGEEEKDQIILRVKDTGRGIPLAEQSKIFDRFYRAKNATEDTQGTGLGLAITKSIIHNHRGRIWVDSKEGAGSTFTVVLPIHKDY
jgi:two-component system NtrC family sensor kinase